MIHLSYIDYIRYEEIGSIIGYRGKEFLVTGLKPKDIIDQLCLQEGTSLQGAIESSRSYLGNQYKMPIRIGTPAVFFLPDRAIDKKECSWMNYDRIRDLSKGYGNTTRVQFDDGNELRIDVSQRYIRKQLKRCEAYRTRIIPSGWFDETKWKGAYHEKQSTEFLAIR